MEACLDPHKGFGYCRRHLDRERAAGRLLEDAAICAFVECGNPISGNGLCQGHRKQRQKGQELRPLAKRQSRDGVCGGPECTFSIQANGLCAAHDWQRAQGRELTPVDRTPRVPKGTPCWVEDCGRPSLTKDGICRTHYQYRLDAPGNWERPIEKRAAHGEGHLDKDGYRIVSVDGRTRREHHVFAEDLLGRSLVGAENVHHVNGNRSDNRTGGPFEMDDRGRLRSGNLEVWSTAQPAGQEIGPKLDWAREMLALYGTPEERLAYGVAATRP